MNFPFLEFPLKLPRLFLVKLRGVLFNAQGAYEILFVKEAIVVWLQISLLYLFKCARAMMSGTDSANRHCLETATGVTLVDYFVA